MLCSIVRISRTQLFWRVVRCPIESFSRLGRKWREDAVSVAACFDVGSALGGLLMVLWQSSIISNGISPSLWSTPSSSYLAPDWPMTGSVRNENYSLGTPACNLMSILARFKTGPVPSEAFIVYLTQGRVTHCTATQCKLQERTV